ncbi:MAG: ATP-grasp domain-containing protein [Planctomycetaceae bacterium]|nr:ATP-grasp domain-containing protein [Planctomycetaceae bacterium]
MDANHLAAICETQPSTFWITTGGLDLEPECLQALNHGAHQLLGCSLDAIRFCKSQQLWTEALRRANISTIPSCVSPACPPGHWHFKRNWPEASPSWFWQEHVAGTLGSVIFLASHTGIELVGCSRLFTLADWRYLGNVADHAWPDSETREELLRMAGVLAGETPLRGLFGIDFMLGQRLWVLEINPRPTASVEVLANLLGRNLYGEHVTQCWPDQTNLPEWGIANATQQTDSPIMSSAKRIIYNSNMELKVTDAIFDRLRRLNRFQCERQIFQLGDAGGEIRLADLPPPGTLIPAFEPICSILFRTTTTPDPQESSVELIWEKLEKLGQSLFSDSV